MWQALGGDAELLWILIMLMGASLSMWAVSVRAALAVLSSAAVERAIQSGARYSRSLEHWRNKPRSFVGTLAVTQSIGLLVCGAVGMRYWQTSWSEAFEASTLVLLSAVLVAFLAAFLFLLPEEMGRQFSVTWSRLNLPLLNLISYFTRPLLWPGLLLLRTWDKLSRTPMRSILTADDLYHSIDELRAEGLDGSGEELLHSILEFSDTLIHEIMVPRIEMVALPLSCTMEEVWKTVDEAGHSRLPIYGQSIDDLAGVLHVKDLITAMAPSRDAASLDLREHLRPLYYVPEVMKISELLREFQRRKTHMAIVVDEYGRTTGVVTLEDVIEEIVGEIQDEYDVEEKQFQRVSEFRIVADGRVSIDELEAELEIDFPDNANFETLAGFLTQRTGQLPIQGQVIRWQDLRFTIKEADERRIITVQIDIGKDSK